MIIAIADDFTGAAELGGIGLRYGLDVEICRTVPDYTKADILIIATNTRAMDEQQATEKINSILDQLNNFGVENLFKKTDSILRGHVIAELEAIRQHLGENHKILLVPCNPSLDRIISDGIYYVKDKPIHQTSFVDEYRQKPASSGILDILNTKRQDIAILSTDQSFTSRCFVVGEAETTRQVESWAREGVTGRRILGGGSDFFSAFLKARGYSQKHSASSAFRLNFSEGASKWLFVCGSASEVSRRYIEQARNRGQAVNLMPESLFESLSAGYGINQSLIDQWADEINHAIEENHQVIVAIQKPLIKDETVSQKLGSCLAQVTARVLNNTDIKELVIEGGATAAAVIRHQGYSKLLPVQELAPGVIRMQVAGQPQLNMTLKPGSYPWPESVWNL